MTAHLLELSSATRLCLSTAPVRICCSDVLLISPSAPLFLSSPALTSKMCSYAPSWRPVSSFGTAGFYQWKQFLLSFLLIHNSLPRSSIIFILTDWSSDCSILLIALPQNLIRMIKCKSRLLLKLSLSPLLPISAWNRSLLLFLQLLLLLWLLFCYLHNLHFFCSLLSLGSGSWKLIIWSTLCYLTFILECEF